MAFTAFLMAMVGGPTKKTTVGDNGDWAVILVISKCLLFVKFCGSGVAPKMRTCVFLLCVCDVLFLVGGSQKRSHAVALYEIFSVTT